MTSIRNIESSEDALLDAARECIMAVGWKRTTLTDVARRAGVSRMTLYRAWPDMQTLLADLMTREWATVAAAAADETAAQDTAAARLAAGVVALVRGLRVNPLLRKIVEVDPELLLPYLLDRRGRSQDGILEILEGIVIDGQAEGSIRQSDPKLLARSVLLAAHGVAISAQTMADKVRVGQLTVELGSMVERYVAP